MHTEQTFRLLLLAGSLIILPMMIYHRLKASTGEPLDRRKEGLLILLLLRPLGLATLAGVATCLARPQAMAWASAPFPDWVRWIGVALLAVTGVLLFSAVHTLGPNLTDTVVTRSRHTLVTAGPYRWIRHPFYVSVVMMLTAYGLGAANWFILAGAGLILAVFRMRTDIEEAQLTARFGDAYRDYMRHTGRFIPRLRGTTASLTQSRA